MKNKRVNRDKKFKKEIVKKDLIKIKKETERKISNKNQINKPTNQQNKNPNPKQ